MAKNYTRFKLLTDTYYSSNVYFTLHPDGILNEFSGTLEDTNLVYICDGYSKNYIFFRLSVLIQVNPKVIFMPISLKRIKSKELRSRIRAFYEYIRLKYA